MMIRRCVSVAGIAVACLLPFAAFAMDSNIVVRAGLARVDGQGGVSIYKDTTTIPFVSKTANPDYYFGVAAATTGGQGLLCHAVVYLPRRDAIHLGDGDENDDVGDALISSVPYSVITTRDVEVPVCNTYLRLNDGDLPGRYIVELYIGGRMQQRVVFDVRPK